MMGNFLEVLNKNFNWLFPNFVQLLTHGLLGLAANPIAKSFSWTRYMKKWASPAIARVRPEKYGLAQLANGL